MTVTYPRPRVKRVGAGDKPRLEDVAARAGIATITVSRVLRQPDKVSPKTRARVLAAVEELGYIPNLAASSLASRRSRIVAVIVPTIANSVFAETVQGLSTVLSARGLQLLLGESAYASETEHAIVAAVIGRQPDGIVFIGVARDAQTRLLLAKAGIPIVETWDLTTDPLDLLVGFSNYEAGRAMTRHLVARGYRRIAFIGGADDRAAARRRGCRDVLAESGLPPDGGFVIADGVSYGAGRRALPELLARAPDTDAVWFATDVLAAGALLEAQRVGIAVPGRLAIAGFGDLEISADLNPALTTVLVPSQAIGRRAGELLLARIGAEPIAEPIHDLGFAIVERAST